jgi:LysR family transcriptional regulator, low CO2-responsive transcriptional regulator
MDRDQLAAFDHIVREGSFTRAAVALGIGQPAVSARVQALEDEIGGILFTRGRRVALTSLGETFLPFARRALDVLGEGVDAARRAQVGQRGHIRIACLGSVAGGLLGPALARFAHGYPDVDCTVRAGNHERVVALLLDGVVDLGLVAWPCSEAPAADLRPVLLLREPVVCAVAPSHPLAGRSRVSADDVARLARPFLRLRWWQKHHPGLVRLAERAGAAVDIAMETARALALEGAGAGFFVKTYIDEDLRRGALVEVRVRDQPRVFRDSALVRRGRATPLSPASANLVEAIRRRAVELGIALPRRR